MIDIRIVDYYSLLAFFLILARISALIISLPIFDNQVINGIIKILTSIVISYFLFDHLKTPVLKDIHYLGIENIVILVAAYVVMGLLIGLVLKSILIIFTMVGELISQHVGFTSLRYFSPMTGTSGGPFEQLLNFGMIIVIVTSGAMLPMFKGMMLSFETVNLINLIKLDGISLFFTYFFRGLFEASIILAAPIIFINILITVVLAITARMIPQMNVLLMSFVINIGLGLIVFVIVSHDFFLYSLFYLLR